MLRTCCVNGWRWKIVTLIEVRDNQRPRGNLGVFVCVCLWVSVYRLAAGWFTCLQSLPHWYLCFEPNLSSYVIGAVSAPDNTHNAPLCSLAAILISFRHFRVAPTCTLTLMHPFSVGRGSCSNIHMKYHSTNWKQIVCISFSGLN